MNRTSEESSSSRGGPSGADSRRAGRVLAPVVLMAGLVILAALVLPGMGWGLPSTRRNELTLGPDRGRWRAPVLRPGEAEDPWAAYPNYLPGAPERRGSLPRSAFNPLRSYHPDEYVILKSLSGMRPAEGRLFHGFFGWPALQFYVLGASMKAASLLGAVELRPDMDYYFAHPGAMAAMYRVGRVVTFLFAVGCLLAVWRGASRLLGEFGGASAALLLAVMPIFVVNSRWMTGDVPMLFWLLLTFHAAVHIAEGDGRRWYIWGGICAGLAAATRYQGALAAWLVLVAHLMRRGETEEGRGVARRLASRLCAGPLWLAAILAIGVFLATNPYVLARPAAFVREVAREFASARVAHGFLLNLPVFVANGAGSTMAVVFVGAVLMAARLRERGPAYLLLAFGPPGAFLLLQRPTMLRYVLPVAPLCPLLIGWALGRLHRQGLAVRRRGAWVAAPLLVVALVGLTAVQTGFYCRLFWDEAADTRTRAGEWIARHVPAGVTVGVVAKPGERDSTPWQFELPPLDERAYRIVILAPWREGWQDDPPDYVVASDLQFPPLATRDPLGPTEERFRSEIFRGGERYAVAARFEWWPTGMRTLLRSAPQDMRYPNPVIVVARRRSR